MTLRSFLAALAAASVLLACGGSPDTRLGDFAAITKKETDPAFKLVAPSSKSPAKFSFSIDNAAVATVNGDEVTIVGPGTAIITATQPELGSFGPSHGTTTLTVEVVPCPSGQTRINKVCEAIPTCTAPATLQNNQCVAAATTAAFVTAGGLSWMPVEHVDLWSNARSYCQTTVIQGAAGWRQPTDAELNTLYASGQTSDRGWSLGNTWSSVMASVSQDGGHVAVHLGTGVATERAPTAGAYVACVRAAQ